MTNKKGDLTFSTIITATIAVTVLIVVILIFTGKLGPVNRALSQCDGVCVGENNPCPSGTTKYSIGDPDCKEKDSNLPICCKNISFVG